MCPLPSCTVCVKCSSPGPKCFKSPAQILGLSKSNKGLVWTFACRTPKGTLYLILRQWYSEHVDRWKTFSSYLCHPSFRKKFRGKKHTAKAPGPGAPQWEARSRST